MLFASLVQLFTHVHRDCLDGGLVWLRADEVRQTFFFLAWWGRGRTLKPRCHFLHQFDCRYFIAYLFDWK